MVKLRTSLLREILFQASAVIVVTTAITVKVGQINAAQTDGQAVAQQQTSTMPHERASAVLKP